MHDINHNVHDINHNVHDINHAAALTILYGTHCGVTVNGVVHLRKYAPPMTEEGRADSEASILMHVIAHQRCTATCHNSVEAKSTKTQDHRNTLNKSMVARSASPQATGEATQ